VEQRLAEMERRLVRAERRARTSGIAATGAVVATIVLVGVKPALTETPGTTVKMPFRVVDATGKARLIVDPVGKGTRLLFSGQDGVPTTILFAGRGAFGTQGDFLGFFDKNRNALATIGFSATGSGGTVSLRSAKQKEGSAFLN
jgi:hypothetical protein